MLRQVLRELRFHPSRFVATVIAIAISVAFMAGSSILVATETNGFQRLQSLPISTADVVVTLGPDADRGAVHTPRQREPRLFQRSAPLERPGQAAGEPGRSAGKRSEPLQREGGRLGPHLVAVVVPQAATTVSSGKSESRRLRMIRGS